jgi:Tfp pilus assembly protein PilX
MKTINLRDGNNFPGQFAKRPGERGAALITVMMVSFLMLVAVAGVLVESSRNTANVSDATAEEQAYYAAESGIQSALSALRGGAVPSPLLDSSKPATDPANKLNFARAVSLTTSNKAAEAGVVTDARLSRWLNYSYTPAGSAFADRVPTTGSDSTTYSPQNGEAFSLSIVDPDHGSESLTFYTTALIGGQAGSKTYGTSPNSATITFQPASSTTLNTSAGASVATTYGKFVISATGSGAAVPADTRFQIVVHLTQPFPDFAAARVLRGTLTAGTITPTSAGGVTAVFDSQYYDLMGSFIKLNPSGTESITLNAPNASGGLTILNATMDPVEPIRIVVTSTGYGPRGARKQLEAVVEKNFFDGLSAPAALTLVGPSSGFNFDPGSSSRVVYSGNDPSGLLQLPSIGVSNQTNLDAVTASFRSNQRTPPDPPPANVLEEMPDWLSSTSELDNTIQRLRRVAIASGRYFSSGQTPTDGFGNVATARGLTFMEGNASMSGSGGGILVVTGTLSFSGGVDFNGLIIITGSGGLTRSGGGGGTIQGNTVIAPYNPSNLAAGFLAPRYDISGGGNSTLTFNASSVGNGQMAVSNFTQGIAEK